MKIALIAICVSLVVIEAGCASKAFLRADQSVLGSFDTAANLYIETRDAMSVEEGNFMVLLVEQIKKSGLKIETDRTIANYILIFSVKEITLLSQQVRYEPVLNPIFRDDEATLFYYPVSSLYGHSGVKIEVAIYLKQDLLKPPRIPVWEASVLAQKETYRSQGAELINAMLGYIGMSYEGSIKVIKNE